MDLPKFVDRKREKGAITQKSTYYDDQLIRHKFTKSFQNKSFRSSITLINKNIFPRKATVEFTPQKRGGNNRRKKVGMSSREDLEKKHNFREVVGVKSFILF